MAVSHSALVGISSDLVPIRRALLSVSDKTNLEVLTRVLVTHGVEVYSTGGTAVFLRQANIQVKDISELSQFPEILNGRVKTLHPAVHGGLLAVRGNETHEKELSEHKIGYIDMVVVNLYPFAETVAKGGNFDTCIENIDIGGPSMIRSASKNNAAVTVVTDVNQYDELIDELNANKGATSLKLRKKFASQAFQKTSAYDSAIADWFKTQV